VGTGKQLPEVCSVVCRQKELPVRVRPLLAGWFTAACVVIAGSSFAFAAPSADRLLPANTKGFLSVPDVARLNAQFNRSQFGQLVSDPAMKPFLDGFRQQLHQQGLKQLDQLGLSWEELEGLPKGEVALAVMEISPDEAAVALVADVTGHADKAAAILAKVGERLSRNGAKRIPRAGGDPTMVYQLVGEPGAKPPVIGYCIYRDMLVACDNIPLLDGMLRALSGERQDSLAAVPAYREIMARCAVQAGGVAPDLRWFIEPFGYAETVRATTSLRDKRRGPDLLKAFRNQGFTAVQGVGGMINFSAGKYELLHRTMVYAPPLPGHTPQDKDKFRYAARLLNFPASGDLLPQAWVPSDMSTYSSFNCDIRNAFASVGTLVDELVGEKGVFRDVLDSLRDDPQGPRIDIEKNLIANLGNRITIISDCELPIGPKSERKVVAIEVTDENAVAMTVRKFMETDKEAHARDFRGHLVWEIVPTKVEVPTVEIEVPGVNVRIAENEPTSRSDRDDRIFSATAFCVAQGHLFAASHVDLLKRVLSGLNPNERLASASDFQHVAAQASELGIGPISFRFFSRSDQACRPTYDLIRSGQMPQSETILNKLLNSILADGKDGIPRKQQIDGHLLPEFDKVRQYFGPAGTFVSSLDDGWLCVGVMLARQPVVAAAPSKTDSPPKAGAQAPAADVGMRSAIEESRAVTARPSRNTLR
jgi:hypothetical protein